MKIVLIYQPEQTHNASLEDSLIRLCKSLDKEPVVLDVKPEQVPICIDEETSMVFYTTPRERKAVKQYLKASRELRIPYTFVAPSAESLIPNSLVCPVTFLEEEAEKGQFAAALARYCDTKITLVTANDYGSKARKTTEKITSLLDKFSLKYQIEKGDKDSFKLYNEIAHKTVSRDWDMLLLSASREYGLDDILFGPPELHAIINSSAAVMLVNPRADLYSLCD